MSKLFLAALVCLLISSVALAQVPPVTDPSPTVPQQVKPADWLPVIDMVFRYLLQILNIIATVFVGSKAGEAIRQGKENAAKIEASDAKAEKDVKHQTELLFAKLQPPTQVQPRPPVYLEDDGQTTDAIRKAMEAMMMKKFEEARQAAEQHPPVVRGMRSASEAQVVQQQPAPSFTVQPTHST